MVSQDAEGGGGSGRRGGVALLRANAPFRRLVTAQATCVGDSLSLVALIVYVASEVGEAYAVALLLLVGDCLPSLLAPLAGSLADRFERRRVMAACEFLQGAAVGAIAVLLPGLALLLPLVALRALAALAFQAASRAAVPGLVDDADLEGANAALGAGAHGLEVLGPLLAAALLPVLDVRGVLLVDAAQLRGLGAAPGRAPAGGRARERRRRAHRAAGRRLARAAQHVGAAGGAPPRAGVHGDRRPQRRRRRGADLPGH